MIRTFATFAILASVGFAAADPCKSGPQPNQRPGPYSSLVCVGKERGTQHCYICESANRPIIIVFARTLNEPLGKLVKKLDGAVKQHKTAELRSWVTFLAEDQAKLDPQIVKWAQQFAISNVPCAVFEDTVGPPTYLLHKEADVTVLLSVKQKVVANFAFRAGELNDAAIAQIVKAIPKIVSGKK
ncbi:MAG: hypothetical protein HYX68_04980 [Planctomycetes bacterium]|nr:hypothetical protein [Planctomycetota bacterium]